MDIHTRVSDRSGIFDRFEEDDDAVQVMDASMVEEVASMKLAVLGGVTDDPYCRCWINESVEEVEPEHHAELRHRLLISLKDQALMPKSRRWYDEFLLTVKKLVRDFTVSLEPAEQPTAIDGPSRTLPGITDDAYCIGVIKGMLERVPEERRAALSRDYLIELAALDSRDKTPEWYVKFTEALGRVNARPKVRKYFDAPEAPGSWKPPAPSHAPPAP